MRLFCQFALFFLIISGLEAVQAQEIGESGAPIPRFISLASDKSFMRTGPGRQYPIAWTYKRQHLPVKVIDEFGPWRRIQDFEGVTGWMHRRILSSRRMAMIVGGPQVLRTEPSMSGKVNARLQEGVMADINECKLEWCKIEHPQVTGWIPRNAIYGVLEDEVID